MASLPVRKATLADVPEIVRITNAAYQVEAFCIRGDRTSAQEVMERMGAGAFLVLEDPNRPDHLLGSVFLSYPSLTRAYLGILAVDPAAQGRGLARQLVEAVEQASRESGRAFLDLSVVNLRTELFPFYQRLGYAPYNTAAFPEPDKRLKPCHLVLLTKPLMPAEQLPAPR
jgi:GNAT superfamily N-acetyltransferase